MSEDAPQGAPPVSTGVKAPVEAGETPTTPDTNATTPAKATSEPQQSATDKGEAPDAPTADEDAAADGPKAEATPEGDSPATDATPEPAASEGDATAGSDDATADDEAGEAEPREDAASEEPEEPVVEVPDLPREELQKKANLLRRERDRLNDEARAHADERDHYNAEVRALVNEANEHKKRRDELNESVRRQKEVRDEANRAADEAHKVADTMRRERNPDAGTHVNVVKLKKEARQLEFQQMTQVLTPKKERALVDRLQEIGRQLRDKEKALKADPELKAALEKADDLKEKAEKTHSKVGELAEKAQGEHDAMIKLYKASDKLRKTADRLQEKFVVSKMEADKIHKQYIGYVNKIHEIEDAMAGHGQMGGASHAQIQSQAEDIYEKFKSGEKLSTDDLLMLQKAGLL